MDLLSHTLERLTAILGADFASRRWLVAASGGRDSMVLVENLSRLVPFENLVLAHFNHRTRPTCDRDEALVEERAAALGCEFARAERAEETATDEASLRRARRFFLERARFVYGAEAILTAHHGNDQLETFLMRVLRGSGIDGLGAMRAREGVWVRPWLEVPRAEIEAAGRAWQVAFHDDESNFEDHYLRNRLRRRLAPVLGELAVEFGGEEKMLARLGGTLGELRAVSDRARADAGALADRLFRETPFWWTAERVEILRESALQRAGLWREMAQRLGAPVPDRAMLERLDRALVDETRAVALPGLRFRLSCGRVFLQNAPQRKRAEQPFTFERVGKAWVCADLGWRVETSTPGVEARFFRAGDRQGGTKLKEIYLARRIPQPQRALLPVVAFEGSADVLWHYGEASTIVSCEGPEFLKIPRPSEEPRTSP